MSPKYPPFQAQRLIFLALLLGQTFYAIVAAVILQTQDGKGLASEPIEHLGTISLLAGGVTLIGALVLRAARRRQAEALQGDDRQAILLLSRLMPLAILEGAGLLTITFWLLSGEAVPHLVVALVVLSISIAITPFTDPDATAA